jgi:hypothetical protein
VRIVSVSPTQHDMRNTIATLFVLCPALLAQDPARQAHDAPRHGPKGAFGVDFTTQYFFRGLQQENQGVIAQPWLRLGYDVHESNEGLRDLDLTFGLWNSLHDGPTGGADGPWFESAFDVDLAAQLEDRLHLGAAYVAYTSPNDSFDNIQELQFRARLDDKAMWFESIESGLQPSMTIAFELNGQRDFGDDRGIYLQAGIAPFFGVGNLGDAPLTLTLPVMAGFSLGDYFEEVGGGNDEFFGFFDVGAELSCPLQFLPVRMGSWDAQAALHWLVLGDNAEERNQGDASELVLSVGVGTRF